MAMKLCFIIPVWLGKYIYTYKHKCKENEIFHEFLAKVVCQFILKVKPSSTYCYDLHANAKKMIITGRIFNGFFNYAYYIGLPDNSA